MVIIMLNITQIIELQEVLELKALNHPILESAMIAAFGIDWGQEEIYIDFYEYAKRALYFDDTPDINTWLDK